MNIFGESNPLTNRSYYQVGYSIMSKTISKIILLHVLPKVPAAYFVCMLASHPECWDITASLIIVAVIPEKCTAGRAVSILNSHRLGIQRWGESVCLILFTCPQLPTTILMWDPERGHTVCRFLC